MKRLSRGNSLLFRKKKEEKQPLETPEEIKEEQNTPEHREDVNKKKNITINLTLNISLDKDSLSKTMDMLDLYSDIIEDSSSYETNGESYNYKNYRDKNPRFT